MKYRVIFGLSQCVTQFASNSKHRAINGYRCHIIITLNGLVLKFIRRIT